jgi:hypothetical protein
MTQQGTARARREDAHSTLDVHHATFPVAISWTGAK